MQTFSSLGVQAVPPESGAEHALVPQPRGPKWKSRRVYGYIEQQVLQQPGWASISYEICQILAPKLKHLTPSPSTVYDPAIRAEPLNAQAARGENCSRRIRASGLPSLEQGPHRGSHALVCVIDACTRLAWAEVVTDLKSLR